MFSRPQRVKHFHPRYVLKLGDLNHDYRSFQAEETQMFAPLAMPLDPQMPRQPRARHFPRCGDVTAILAAEGRPARPGVIPAPDAEHSTWDGPGCLIKPLVAKPFFCYSKSYVEAQKENKSAPSCVGLF